MLGVRAGLIAGMLMAAACGGDGPRTPTAPPPVSSTESCAAFGATTAGSDNVRPNILSGSVCNPSGSSVVRVNLKTETGASAGICTGTLIGPRAVLTAAHCLDGDVRAAQIWLGTGAEIVAASYHFPPGFVFNAPNSFDVGVMLFDQDIPRTPMPILTSREGQVGEAAVIAGWGRDENDVTTQLKAGSTSISAVSAAFLQTIFAPPSASVCSGDSGGPILLQHNGAWAVGGITSATSSAACNTGTNFYQAVFNSNVRGFITQFVPTVAQR